MSSEPIENRRRLLEAVTEAVNGEVVTGFAVVIECSGVNGTRTLTTFSGDAFGDAELPTWTAEGLLKYALEQGMFDAGEEDDDEHSDDD